MGETKIDLSDLRRLRGQLRAAMKKAQDLTPIMKKRAAVLQGLMLKAYTTSQSLYGERFPKLSPRSLAATRVSDRPLLRSGRMQGSTQAKGEKSSVVFGFGVPYAGYHLTGRKRRAVAPVEPSGKIGFSKGDAQKWWTATLEASLRYVLQGVGKPAKQKADG